jgi:hypothetical protein
MTHRNNHRETHRIASLALDGQVARSQVARVSGLLISLVLVLLITTGGAG